MLISLFGNLFSSEPIVVKLNPQKEIILSGRTCYISRVLDNRADRTKKIGETSKKDIMMEEMLDATFLNYLLVVFPQNNQAKTQVTMVINSIECENTSGLLTSKIKVNMDVEFISTYFKDATYKVRVSNGVDRVMPDGKTFANLIERNLVDCMKELKDQIK